jgi:hypothetical protein
MWPALGTPAAKEANIHLHPVCGRWRLQKRVTSVQQLQVKDEGAVGRVPTATHSKRGRPSKKLFWPTRAQGLAARGRGGLAVREYPEGGPALVTGPHVPLVRYAYP